MAERIADTNNFDAPLPFRSEASQEVPVFVERDGSAIWLAIREVGGDSDLFRLSRDPNAALEQFFPNTAQTDEDWLWLSPNGQRAYYTSQGVLNLATRASAGLERDDTFTGPAGISINSFTISCDEREIIFASQGPGMGSTWDLYWATRLSRDDAFEVPQALQGINNDMADELHPWLSALAGAVPITRPRSM